MAGESPRYDFATDILRQVGHDLKSPLTAIIGTIEALLSLGKKLSEQQQETLLRTSLKEAYRLKHFIQNILTLSKLENEDLQVEKRLLDFQTLITPLRDRLLQEYPHVTWQDGEMKGSILADDRWLPEALWQVLDNIGRHNANPVTCSVSLKEGEQVEITVSDDGTGLSPEWSGKIFDKYFKGPATEHQDASAGVGLTIAQNIISAHAGKIDRAPGLAGKGASFTISLDKK